MILSRHDWFLYLSVLCEVGTSSGRVKFHDLNIGMYKSKKYDITFSKASITEYCKFVS
jgi:hypothetical protein